MSKNNVLSGKSFSGLDELFGDPLNANVSCDQVVYIPLCKIRAFKNHPFKVKDDDKMNETVQSIRENGILVPGIVRKIAQNEYELISGHRRKHACETLGLTEMPVIVKDLSDDEATIIMVDANIQRETLDYSEKAYAFKMKFDALKHQGLKSESETADLIGTESGESGRQVRRYIRLTNLIPELLSLVDDKKIGFIPAVELSYLSDEEQNIFYNLINKSKVYPSLDQCKQLKQYSQNNQITTALMENILNQSSKEKKLSFSASKISSYFPSGTTKAEMEQVILELLQNWSH